jgi:hypothetical protein
MAALRIKSQWHRPGSPRTPEQTASAMAFIVWRLTQNMLRQMRGAGFDIDVGPQYFAFMREVLVFLCQLVDRMAYARMAPDERSVFTGAMVRRVADVLQDSVDDLLGPRGVGQQGHGAEFIDLVNTLAGHYADFAYGPGGPDFAFLRYFGYRLEALMPEKDRRWVTDQVMAIEAPQAHAALERAITDVLSTEARPARARRAGALGGD